MSVCFRVVFPLLSWLRHCFCPCVSPPPSPLRHCLPLWSSGIRPAHRRVEPPGSRADSCWSGRCVKFHRLCLVFVTAFALCSSLPLPFVRPRLCRVCSTAFAVCSHCLCLVCSTTFALCVPLPLSCVLHCLCLVCSTAFQCPQNGAPLSTGTGVGSPAVAAHAGEIFVIGKPLPLPGVPLPGVPLPGVPLPGVPLPCVFPPPSWRRQCLSLRPSRGRRLCRRVELPPDPVDLAPPPGPPRLDGLGDKVS